MVLFCSNTQVAIIVDEDLDQEANALFEQLLIVAIHISPLLRVAY
jgi:hypothetical protein